MAPSKGRKTVSDGRTGDRPPQVEPTTFSRRAEQAMKSYMEGLEEISRRLQMGVERDEKAESWANVLNMAVDLKLDYLERERALRAFYVALYGLAATSPLPPVPQNLASILADIGRRKQRGFHVAQQMHQLQISLPEALRQVNTQRHPGAYLLLTCHLGKERPPACQNFPWISLGALLLMIGFLCGPSRQDRETASMVPVEASMDGAAHQVTVIPMVLGALCVCFCRTCRTCFLDGVLCMAFISMISLSWIPLGSNGGLRTTDTRWNHTTEATEADDGRLGLRLERPWNEIGSLETRCFSKAFHRSKVGISKSWHPGNPATRPR